MENKIRTAISYLFGKYDMRTGVENQIRMDNVLKMCMNDIASHPCLENGLDTKEKIEFFVMQTIFYMIPLNDVKSML